MRRREASMWYRTGAQLSGGRLIKSLIVTAGFVGAFQTTASAAIQLSDRSRVMILSGYSADLTKQDLTVLHPALNLLLSALATDLNARFGASVEYLSERGLSQRLEYERLPNREAADIKEIFKRGRYTHLITGDVRLVGKTLEPQFAKESAGFITIRLGQLSVNGSITDMDVMPEKEVSTTKSNWQ